MPELVLRADPDTTLVSFGSREGTDIYAVADELWKLGWYLDRQGPPASLHCTENAVHHGLIPEFLQDLRAVVAQVGGALGEAGCEEHWNRIRR